MQEEQNQAKLPVAYCIMQTSTAAQLLYRKITDMLAALVVLEQEFNQVRDLNAQLIRHAQLGHDKHPFEDNAQEHHAEAVRMVAELRAKYPTLDRAFGPYALGTPKDPIDADATRSEHDCDDDTGASRASDTDDDAGTAPAIEEDDDEEDVIAKN